MIELRRQTDALTADVHIVHLKQAPLVPGYEEVLSVGTVRLSESSIGYLQHDPRYLLPYRFSAQYDMFNDIWHVSCRDSYGDCVPELRLSFSSVDDAFRYCVHQLMFSESQAERIH